MEQAVQFAIDHETSWSRETGDRWGIHRDDSRRAKALTAHPVRWQIELLLGYAIFLLLGLHLLEIVVWAVGLHYSGLVPNWRTAGLFAANNYTALGSGAVLPVGWGMLTPIIAISGLFTFGWTGSVLVSMVGRCNELRELSAAVR